MCSYCGCENIEVIGRFMGEHVAVINASGLLHEACLADDSVQVGARAQTLAGLLAPHTRAEEAGLFAVMAEDPEFTDHIHDLCGEHVHLDDLLATVVAAADRESRLTAYTAFELLLRRHIDKEDNGLFPAAAIAFAGPEWDRVTALTPEA